MPSFLSVIYTQEARQYYHNSVRMGIMDYILKDKSEQERLGVPLPVKDSNAAGRECYPWHTAVISARHFMSTRLYITHPIVSQILYRWETK